MGSIKVGRTLVSLKPVTTFLKNSLELDKTCSKEEFDKIVLEIVSAETQVSETSKNETLTHDVNRLHPYESDEARADLRRQIYDELISMQRLDNDDDIKLGSGGALPKKELSVGKTAFIVIGLPASGKSGISCKISDKFGAIILDSDYAKRKFPEFQIPFGASLVHSESSSVVFGGFPGHEAEPNMLAYAVSNGLNMVIPKIGDVGDKIHLLAKGIKEAGFEVHLVLVRLDREKATQRAIKRYSETRRYVPVSLIYDVYSNNPTITFYDMMILDSYKETFSSFTMFSTDVDYGRDAKLIYASEKSPFSK